MSAPAAARHAACWIALGALLLAVLLAWHFMPLRAWIVALHGFMERLGAWGIVVFAVVYIGIVILLAPAEMMSIAAGVIFGLWGIPLVIVAATIGATLAFLLARYFFRARVRELARRSRVFQAADAAVSQEGWKLVALLRLNPLVPFNLQNYFFGATDIGLWPYLAATFFGIMPGSAAYVYVGTLGQAAATSEERGAFKLALLAVGLLTTVVLVLIVGWRARIVLKNLGVDRNGA